MIAPRRTADEAGFALVDLLVSIAVAGLAGSILVGLVVFVEHDHAKSIRWEREREGAVVVERVLRLVIDNAPPFIPGAPLVSAIAGDEHEVTVISNGPPILNLPQAAAFRLRREAGVSGPDVVLTWFGDEEQEQRTLLAQAVSELALAYLPRGIDPLKGTVSRQMTWRSRWRPEDGPLAALRLELRFGPDSTPRVFVIPIESDLPAACLRHPRQAGCALEGLS